MNKQFVRGAVIVAVILLPILAQFGYTRWTALPSEATIATGPGGGVFLQVSESLAESLRNRLDTRIVTRESEGSLDNLRALEAGQVDFAMYQPGSLEILREFDPDAVREFALDASRDDGEVAFVANMYSQPVHLIVRRGAGVVEPSAPDGNTVDLRGKRVHVGAKRSGDYAAGLLVLHHLGLDLDAIEPEHLSYDEMKQRFESGELDAAIVTIGDHAPILAELFKTGECDLVSIPHAEALATRYVSLSECTIPAGMYASHPDVEPPRDVKTVALGAQLLTRADVPPRLVAAVFNAATDERFLKKNELRELFGEGRAFALRKPEFPVHPGVALTEKSEIHADEVQNWEAAYSLIASAAIAFYLLYREYRKRRARHQQHSLDAFIQSLLTIERKQVRLDSAGERDDTASLQELLDEVTHLRLRALDEFTAHELNEDRAVDCFISMCHALSNKINAKLSRQRMERLARDLAALLERKSPDAG